MSMDNFFKHFFVHSVTISRGIKIFVVSILSYNFEGSEIAEKILYLDRKIFLSQSQFKWVLCLLGD